MKYTVSKSQHKHGLSLSSFSSLIQISLKTKQRENKNIENENNLSDYQLENKAGWNTIQQLKRNGCLYNKVHLKTVMMREMSQTQHHKNLMCHKTPC